MSMPARPNTPHLEALLAASASGAPVRYTPRAGGGGAVRDEALLLYRRAKVYGVDFANRPIDPELVNAVTLDEVIAAENYLDLLEQATHEDVSMSPNQG